MRALLVVAILFASSGAFARGGGGHRSGGTVSVKGHTTKSGTYVQPHHRTAPDGTKSNNWSTKGNVNPYTGKTGTKNP